MVNYPKFNLEDLAKSPKKIGDFFDWHPRYQRLKRGQLAPVNALLAVFYTNLDKDGIHYPLFGRENKKAFEKIKDQLKSANPMKPELHTPEQIKLMLASLSETLKGNKRFQEIKPYYHKGGKHYHLNDKGEVVSEDDHTHAGHVEGFNINHNVAAAGLALGANGCGDCHSSEAHMFKGQIVTDMFGPPFWLPALGLLSEPVSPALPDPVCQHHHADPGVWSGAALHRPGSEGGRLLRGSGGNYLVPAHRTLDASVPDGELPGVGLYRLHLLLQ
jgi:hypothetical protein